MIDEKKKNTVTTMRRLEGRNRLLALARDARESVTENPELERLKVYLLDWAVRQVPLTAARKDFSESCLAQYMKSDSPELSELLGASDAWAMEVIDASVSDLLTLPRGVEMHAALRARYLNEGFSKATGMNIRVFRSGRLQYLTALEADVLADAAEIALIPITKKRRLPL